VIALALRGASAGSRVADFSEDPALVRFLETLDLAKLRHEASPPY